MPYKSFREVVRRSTFIPQLILTFCINFGINFGLAWSSYSNWGAKGHSYETWPSIGVWKWNPEVNSCIAMDLALTCLFMGTLCTLFGTGGVVKDVKDKKVDVLDPSVVSKGIWRFTPVRIHNLCLRSLAQGFYSLLWAGVPTLIVLSIAFRGDDTIPGLAWTCFKGIWAGCVVLPMFCVVYAAGLDPRNFPEMEFEALMHEGGNTPTNMGKILPEAPPLVANVGHV